jgi:DNA polymerase-3 subunit epsilon
LDFETTGTDPLTARPVSAALACLEADGSERFAFHELIDCRVDVPDDAAALHGHSSMDVLLDGLPSRHVMTELVAHLERVAADNLPLVIFNARFDWPLLHVECARHGLEAPRGMYLVDPGVLDRHFDKWRRGKRTLSDCAAVYGLRFTTKAHEALADVVVAIHLAREIGARHAQNVSLLELQGCQADAFRSWRDGINTHWARNGKPDRVEGEWPWGPLGFSPSASQIQEAALV